MPDCKIGEINIFSTFGLVLQPVTMEYPEAKTTYIDIPGRDGALDLTAANGTVRFKDRSFQLVFYKLDKSQSWESMLRSFANVVHANRMQLCIDNEPYYYWTRFEIDNFSTDKNIGKLVVKCTSDPYKYKLLTTVVSQEVSGSAIVNLINERMPTCPIITVDSEMSLVWSLDEYEYTKTLPAGTWKVLELQLPEGVTPITITGNGNIEFEWQEGAL